MAYPALPRPNRLVRTSSARTLSRRTARSWTSYPLLIFAFVMIGLLILMFIGNVIYQNHRPNFTIGAGDDLQRHLNYHDSITVAQRAGLPIYMKMMGSQRVSIGADYAYRLEQTLGKNLVTVPVYEGDHFDLRWGFHFTPAPGKLAPTSRHP